MGKKYVLYDDVLKKFGVKDTCISCDRADGESNCMVYKMSMYDICDAVTSLPSANVQHVIRCKECKHFIPEASKNGFRVGSHCGRFNHVVTEIVREGEKKPIKTHFWCYENSYCSFAEGKNK